jgi:hypothetical protein
VWGPAAVEPTDERQHRRREHQRLRRQPR